MQIARLQRLLLEAPVERHQIGLEETVRLFERPDRSQPHLLDQPVFFARKENLARVL